MYSCICMTALFITPAHQPHQVQPTDHVFSHASPPPPASTRTRFDGCAPSTSSRINSGRSYRPTEPRTRQEIVHAAILPPRKCTCSNSPAKKKKQYVTGSLPHQIHQGAILLVCAFFFGPARFDSRWFLDLRGAYHSTATTEPFLTHGEPRWWPHMEQQHGHNEPRILICSC
jgi:hypothetical protein